jgi:hypothetical protein
MTLQFTVVFARVPQQEAPLDVCWHNLMFADRLHHLELFAGSAQAWIALTGATSYQQLERELRQRRCETQLIAVPRTNPALDIRFNNDERRACGHQLVFSCRPRPMALEEMHQHCASYEQNLERLADAGDIAMPAPEGAVKPGTPNLFSVLRDCRHKLTIAV